MAIRYAVDLTDPERAAWREIVSKNKAKRSTIIHASILLKADRAWGWTNANIAVAYEVATKKVEPLKKRFVEAGVEAALSRKPVTKAHRRKITGDDAAHWIALFCSQAPEGHERWTLRMLAEKMVELDIVDAVSPETTRQTWKKTDWNRGKSKHGVFRQSKMPPASATWKKSEMSTKNRMLLSARKCVWMPCRPNWWVKSVPLSPLSLANHWAMTLSRREMALPIFVWLLTPELANGMPKSLRSEHKWIGRTLSQNPRIPELVEQPYPQVEKMRLVMANRHYRV